MASLVMLASSMVAGQAPATRPSAGGAAWESYALILTRNIFVRDRARLAAVSDAPAQGPQDSDSTVVLTGVAVRGGSRIAFFENRSTGETKQIRLGQSIGKGRVADISLDRVQYRAGEAMREVQVGETLSGAAPTTTSAPATAGTSAPAAGAPAPGATSPAAAPASSNDILERMRQRRLQEMK